MSVTEISIGDPATSARHRGQAAGVGMVMTTIGVGIVQSFAGDRLSWRR